MGGHHLSILASSNSPFIPLCSLVISLHRSLLHLLWPMAKPFLSGLTINSSWPLVGPVGSYLNAIEMSQARLPICH